MGSQRVNHDQATEMNWTELILYSKFHMYFCYHVESSSFYTIFKLPLLFGCQNLSKLLYLVWNQCKRYNELGKNPKEKENVEFKDNEDDKLELFNLKDKRLRWSPVFK